MASLFGIIDAAQDERLYDWIVAEPEHACLFSGPLDPELARAAPYIVRLSDDSPLLQLWATQGRGRNWGIQCMSDRSLPELRRHFRSFLQAKLPDGRFVLFRFYDPRVWRDYLPTSAASELATWFRSVDTYFCERGGSFATVAYTLKYDSLQTELTGN